MKLKEIKCKSCGSSDFLKQDLHLKCNHCESLYELISEIKIDIPIELKKEIDIKMTNIKTNNTIIRGNMNNITGDNNIIYGNMNNVTGNNNIITGKMNSIKGANNIAHGKMNDLD